MRSLDENDWKPFSLGGLFDSLIRGRVSSVAEEPKCYYGVPYVGATDKNNGVLDFLEPNSEKIQQGNCITFIRDGQGSVGSSIYRATPFIATVNTTSGYAAWLNEYNGIFVSTASNQVRSKYSFGYKRKEERLIAEKVMLPTTNKGDPDNAYMTEFICNKCNLMINRYRVWVEDHVKDLGEQVGIKQLSEKEFGAFFIVDLFELSRGKEGDMASLAAGNIPLISAKSKNNGLKGFVKTANISGNCITLNNDGDGGAGLAYYQPFDMALDTHVTALIPKFAMSNYTMLFISQCLSSLHDFFGHGLSISNKRAKNIKVMLPIDEDNRPDWKYMEQYAKNMMLKKYKQYLKFIEARVSHKT